MAKKFILDKQQQQTILFVGAVTLGYFYVIKPILEKFGGKKSAEQKKLEKRKKEQIDVKVQEEKKIFKGYLSDAEAQSIADSIYNSLATAEISDKPKIAEATLMKIRSDADWWNIYRLFGRRQQYFFGLRSGGLVDLDQFISENLSKKAIQRINNAWNSGKVFATVWQKQLGKPPKFTKVLR
jgi:hypothetical protein